LTDADVLNIVVFIDLTPASRTAYNVRELRSQLRGETAAIGYAD
jgi:hypothetical protein